MSSDKWCTRDFFVEDEESQYSFFGSFGFSLNLFDRRNRVTKHHKCHVTCDFFFFSYQCWFMYLLGSVCVHSLVFEFVRNVMVVQISHHVMVCCDFLLFNGSICLFYGICNSRLSTIEKKHEVIETVSKKTIDLVRNSYFPLNIYEKMVWYCVISMVLNSKSFILLV